MENRLDETQTIERWGIRFTGIVQGVGFRPLVSVLAHQLALSGFVYNDGHGVYVEAQGTVEALDLFLDAVKVESPRLARITSVNITKMDIHMDDCIDRSQPSPEEAFVIKPSPKGMKVKTFISADTAPCEDCYKELHDANEQRRHEYSFINCTHCGPRYTIIKAMPYDRERTTMNDFPMCPDCEREYEDIEGRRYHAEPNACHVCGPQYQLLDAHGTVVETDEVKAFAQVRHMIADGYIVAIKGIGGYHLACDAFNETAVQRLRERKQRPMKPLAMMAGSLEILDDIVTISDAELDVLISPARPIVLLQSKPEVPSVPAPSVAPGCQSYGIMLPYTPMHMVLLPKDALWVMTSGNHSGEPVLYKDVEALEQLSTVADYFLTHNRQIWSPVDDSVVAVCDKHILQYRRSRGFVPEPIHCSGLLNNTMLAMGSDLKNAFAMNQDQEVLMGPHIGDLEHSSTHETLEKTITHYEKLFDATPTEIVVDAHSQYFSSRLGYAYGERHNIPVLEVQHHHAHIASVMAEHNLQGPLLGICFDGTGYGDDGTLWGGEFLICQQGGYKRVAHLQTAPLPGGEKAVREPWRQALWYVRQHYGTDVPAVYKKWLHTLPEGWELLDQALNSDMVFSLSSGAGRLFDALGCLLGLGNIHAYDAHIAMALEQVALGQRGNVREFNYDGTTLDLTPTIFSLMDEYAAGADVSALAASFHRTLAIAICEVSSDICSRYNIDQVAISGGVFQNRQLLQELHRTWHRSKLYMNEKVPCNDGGLALGQLWIAHQLKK